MFNEWNVSRIATSKNVFFNNEMIFLIENEAVTVYLVRIIINFHNTIVSNNSYASNISICYLLWLYERINRKHKFAFYQQVENRDGKQFK